jgi:hypothetical protein
MKPAESNKILERNIKRYKKNKPDPKWTEDSYRKGWNRKPAESGK